MTANAWIRDRALTLALMAMFLLFLVGQVFTGLAVRNDEQAEHGRATVALAGYLATGHPWEALLENSAFRDADGTVTLRSAVRIWAAQLRGIGPSEPGTACATVRV